MTDDDTQDQHHTQNTRCIHGDDVGRNEVRYSLSVTFIQKLQQQTIIHSRQDAMLTKCWYDVGQTS